MKLLTLNTHSLMENDYEDKLKQFVNAVAKHQVDVIALQEIMQPIDGEKSDLECVTLGKIPLKNGNHALNIIKALGKMGHKYNLFWLGFKKSYDKFDEGLAILTKHKVEDAKEVTLTPFDTYENWKTRKALAVKIKGEWFYSVHFGWWDSFKYEYEQLINSINRIEQNWLMGDFNSIAAERDKGYDLMINSGVYDTFVLAANKDEGYTANTKIDGWQKESDPEKIRIDYIFVTKKTEIKSSFVIFNGANEPVVSDHFGILVTTEEK